MLVKNVYPECLHLSSDWKHLPEYQYFEGGSYLINCSFSFYLSIWSLFELFIYRNIQLTQLCLPWTMYSVKSNTGGPFQLFNWCLEQAMCSYISFRLLHLCLTSVYNNYCITTFVISACNNFCMNNICV